MKNLVVTAALTVSVIVVGIVACSRPKLKMQPVQPQAFSQGLAIANPNSEEAIAKRDSIATYKKFRAEAVSKLSRNYTQLSQFRSSIDTNKACTDKVACENIADSLVQENNNLVVKLDNSKADKNWIKRKREVKSDIDKLSFAIRMLSKGNKERAQK